MRMGNWVLGLGDVSLEFVDNFKSHRQFAIRLYGYNQHEKPLHRRSELGTKSRTRTGTIPWSRRRDEIAPKRLTTPVVASFFRLSGTTETRI